MMQKRKITTGLLALGAAGALGLTACSGDGGGDGGDGDKGTITIGVANGWEEDIAISELWKLVLEDQGYEVELEYADIGPIYQGVAGGDYDLYLDAWLPITHGDYIDNYEGQMVELSEWNSDAKLTIAVNEDAPIDSLDELADNADLFGNRIVGIEAGAGLTQVTEDEVIPTYGLEGMDYVISSTPAMLTELDSATQAGDNIVVTLWRPHWAYEAFPVKDLEDPEGTLGEAEGMYVYANSEFESEQPEAAEWFKNFEMDSETLYSLENVMFNENDDPNNYPDIIRQWMEDNQEYIDSLTQ